MKKCSGIILKTSYENMGCTADIELLGKTMLEWVSLSLLGSPVTAIDYRTDVTIPVLIRPYLDLDSEYTVVLYSDTPLITRKSVSDAIELAIASDIVDKTVEEQKNACLQKSTTPTSFV